MEGDRDRVMSEIEDRDLFCQKCQKTVPCRFQPSSDAGPYWRCSECGEIVDRGSPELIELFRKSTRLWGNVYESIDHNHHCTMGPPGMEGCPGGVSCPDAGPLHDDIHTIRSTILTLEQLLRMKQGKFCCQIPDETPTPTVLIPKCKHGSPGWCSICGPAPFTGGNR